LQLLKAKSVDANRLWRYQAALGEKEAVISALLLRLEVDIHPGVNARGFPNITTWVSVSVPYGYFATAQ
jgi:hypothetical protein